MADTPTALERAFELARSGDFTTTSDIRRKLREEGLSEHQLEGPTLMRQLREIIVSGQATKAAKEADSD